jgi:hypothetical protein
MRETGDGGLGDGDRRTVPGGLKATRGVGERIKVEAGDGCHIDPPG